MYEISSAACMQRSYDNFNIFKQANLKGLEYSYIMLCETIKTTENKVSDRGD